jgi:hypothetical protein
MKLVRNLKRPAISINKQEHAALQESHHLVGSSANMLEARFSSSGPSTLPSLSPRASPGK